MGKGKQQKSAGKAAAAVASAGGSKHASDKRTRRALAAQRRGTSEWDEEESALKKQLADLGLFARSVRGDGNCLFRAISDQIAGDESKHGELRTLAVRYMRRNEDDFAPFLLEEEGWKSFEEYCAAMENEADGEWAGNMELIALSRALRVNIVVHQPGQPRWEVLVEVPTAAADKDKDGSGGKGGKSVGKTSAKGGAGGKGKKAAAAPAVAPATAAPPVVYPTIHVTHHDQHYDSVRQLGDTGHGPAQHGSSLAAGQGSGSAGTKSSTTASSSSSSGDGDPASIEERLVLRAFPAVPGGPTPPSRDQVRAALVTAAASGAGISCVEVAIEILSEELAAAAAAAAAAPPTTPAPAPPAAAAPAPASAPLPVPPPAPATAAATVPVASVPAAVDDTPWTCALCGYENPPPSLALQPACEICDAPRSSSGSSNPPATDSASANSSTVTAVATPPPTAPIAVVALVETAAAAAPQPQHKAAVDSDEEEQGDDTGKRTLVVRAKTDEDDVEEESESESDGKPSRSSRPKHYLGSVRRNGPCPCGSGRTYRKCHEAIDSAAKRKAKADGASASGGASRSSGAGGGDSSGLLAGMQAVQI